MRTRRTRVWRHSYRGPADSTQQGPAARYTPGHTIKTGDFNGLFISVAELEQPGAGIFRATPNLAVLGGTETGIFKAALEPESIFGQLEPRPPFLRQLRLDLLGKQKRKTRLVIRMNKV